MTDGGYDCLLTVCLDKERTLRLLERLDGSDRPCAASFGKPGAGGYREVTIHCDAGDIGYFRDALKDKCYENKGQI